MAAVLHLLKSHDTTLARAVLDRSLPGGAAAGLPPGVSIRSLDGDLSYGQLLELIFEADQVVTW
jgi:hypothetical protein